MAFVNESDFYTVEPLWAAGWSEEASGLQPGDIAIHHGEPGTKRFQATPTHAVIIIAPNTYFDLDPEKKRLRMRSIGTFPTRAAVFRSVSDTFIKKRAAAMSLLAERAKKRKLDKEEDAPEDLRYFSWKFVLNCYRWDVPKDSPYYINLTADTISPESLEEYLVATPNFRLRGRITGE